MRQHGPLAHRIHAVVRAIGQAGAVADRQYSAVRAALQLGIDQHKALSITGQTAVCQPGQGAGTTGDDQPRALPDGLTVADQLVINNRLHGAVFPHRDALPGQLPERALAQRRRMAGQ